MDGNPAGQAAARDEAPEPPSSARPADGPRQLSCGFSVHFADSDAHVGCSRQEVGQQTFLSLTLLLAGKGYQPRAVMGANEVLFEGPPDAVVAVTDVDVEAGRLTVFPPTLATP